MSDRTHWIDSSSSSDEATTLATVDALCLGTGRFLRSVLVPSLVGAGLSVGLIQARGRTFLEYMASRKEDGDQKNHGYEVDTVLPSGDFDTKQVPCVAAFSLGRNEDKAALYECLPKLQGISILGVGVTEAGLSSYNTPVLFELYHLLIQIHRLGENGDWPKTEKKICVIDMDNIPQNGSLLAAYLLRLASEDETNGATMTPFLQTSVVFLNSMVDRITAQRPGSSGMVPRCEPMPAKALVLLDPQADLPPRLKDQPGVVVRTEPAQLQADIALKLRIANGSHTAIAHVLALLQHLQTDVLSRPDHSPFMMYLDAFVEGQLIPGAVGMEDEARLVWQDWRQRLVHAHFGLSSFFITQNGTAKGGIRWGPTVKDLVGKHQKDNSAGGLNCSMAFAYAVLLRWLTPLSTDNASTDPQISVGWLEGGDPNRSSRSATGSEEYADGLRYHLTELWYEYKCPLLCENQNRLALLLQKCIGLQPSECTHRIRQYLIAKEGGDLSTIADSPQFDHLVSAIAVIYARLISGDGVQEVLQELVDGKVGSVGLQSPCSELSSSEMVIANVNRALHFRSSVIPDSSRLLSLPVGVSAAASVVTAEVRSTVGIDLHTHLLPTTHGTLCSWGIDEMLTYHYLVSEFFMTAPASLSPESFYAESKQKQADRVWKSLFIDRSPISEACRGVLTTLGALGLQQEVCKRDLNAIRQFYDSYRSNGTEGATVFCEKIFRLSGIEYAIMTNIPFEEAETKFWRGAHHQGFSTQFRAALRVDPLLAGDWTIIKAALGGSGYDSSLEGARQYLRDWCDTMKPEYMMASTPHDFVLQDGTLSSAVPKSGLDEEAMKQPGAFATALVSTEAGRCDPAEEEMPSVINEESDFLGDVLMKVCEERDLPVALKIGAHRGVNPQLQAAGDGMVAFADASMLGRLCTRFPKVRFLATFLSRNNQHEACVLAAKFRNLHIYGCWWYCNNPSIIKEITQMRVEMLGTSFTAQHSDARVVDQLLYKWPHSRAIIASVLVNEITKSIEAGWYPTRREIRRDVRRLFRGSYEEFMAKSLL